MAWDTDSCRPNRRLRASGRRLACLSSLSGFLGGFELLSEMSHLALQMLRLGTSICLTSILFGSLGLLGRVVKLTFVACLEILALKIVD